MESNVENGTIVNIEVKISTPMTSKRPPPKTRVVGCVRAFHDDITFPKSSQVHLQQALNEGCTLSMLSQSHHML